MEDNGFRMTIDADDVLAVLRKFPEATRKRVTELVEGSAIDVQRELIAAAPVGVGGGAGLRGSVRYKLKVSGQGIQAEIMPAVSYALDVEEGTPPHWTSVAEGSSLRAWANLKGVSPYALQRSIAKKGTKAHPYVKPTYDLMQPVVSKQLIRGITSFVQEVNDGRL